MTLDANQAATILDKSVFAAEQNKAEQRFSGGEQLLTTAVTHHPKWDAFLSPTWFGGSVRAELSRNFAPV